MKQSLKIFVFFSVAIFALTNCENPTIDTQLPYYYHETIAYLPASGTQSVEFQHTPSGIKEKEILFTVARKNNNADKMESELQKECTVVLEAAIDGIEPEYVTFRDGMTLTIPAGETEVSSAFDIDWSFAAETATVVECTITISIANINVHPSEEKSQSIYKITKSELSNIYTTAPSGTLVEDQQQWIVECTNDETLSNWSVTSKLTNNDKNDYVWYDSSFLAIKVNLGTVKALTGVASYSSYGSNYAPSSLIMETSTNGTNWTPVGSKIKVTPASYTYASFHDPVEAQYIRLQMFGTSVLSSEIYAWVK